MRSFTSCAPNLGLQRQSCKAKIHTTHATPVISRLGHAKSLIYLSSYRAGSTSRRGFSPAFGTQSTGQISSRQPRLIANLTLRPCSCSSRPCTLLVSDYSLLLTQAKHFLAGLCKLTLLLSEFGSTIRIHSVGFFSSLVASFVAKHRGRKLCMVLSGICYLIGAGLTTGAVPKKGGLGMLILGRIMLGVGVGFANAVRPGQKRLLMYRRRMLRKRHIHKEIVECNEQDMLIAFLLWKHKVSERRLPPCKSIDIDSSLATVDTVKLHMIVKPIQVLVKILMESKVID